MDRNILKVKELTKSLKNLIPLSLNKKHTQGKKTPKNVKPIEKQVKKLLKPVNKPSKPVKKQSKPVKKLTTVIEDEKNTNNLKLEDKAIYLFTMRTCPYCQAMKSDWNKAKSENPTTKIYEVHAQMVNHYPMFRRIVVSYPTILKYDNKKFKVFENNRTIENFSSFMKNYKTI